MRRSSASHRKVGAATPLGATVYAAASAAYTLALTDPTVVRDHRVYNPGDWRFGGARIDRDVRYLGGPENGSAGLVLRAQDPPAGADDSRASYTVYPGARGTVAVYAARPGGGQVLLPITTNAAVNRGTATNHLAVESRGNQLVVVVNGAIVARVTGQLAAPGALGVTVVGPPGGGDAPAASAAFAHLLVTDLEVSR